MTASPATHAHQRALDNSAVAAALRRLASAGVAPWLHGEVARRMAERLTAIKLKPQRLIDWWGFSGAGGAALEAAYPHALRVVVEPTAALLELSRAAVRRPWWTLQHWRGPSIEFCLEGAEQVPGTQLIWANMMLHAQRDPPALFARWYELLQADGFVMFSCLGPATLTELRALYVGLGWPAPTPAFVDMHDLGDMLVNAGFADPVLDQETLTLHWAGPRELLAELRSLGGNAAPDRFPGLRTPRWRDALIEALGSLRGPDGRLHLSFEVAYGHAFKAPPRIRAGEPTLVSLQDMRAMVRARKPLGGGVTRARDNADGSPSAALRL
jgi:malonyl-CoA O-methyltransferase